LIQNEDDEVLFAVAEEIGNIFSLVHDKSVFLPQLETLAQHDETVVREEATQSLIKICGFLSEADI
jgi:serine/threonine-protein phosphatase 2A regulatory subunit A